MPNEVEILVTAKDLAKATFAGAKAQTTDREPGQNREASRGPGQTRCGIEIQESGTANACDLTRRREMAASIGGIHERICNRRCGRAFSRARRRYGRD